MPVLSRCRLSALIVLALVNSACEHRSTEPRLSPGLVTGSYVREPLSGGGPWSASFTLTSPGMAVWRTRYSTGYGTIIEEASIGTFRLTADSIMFALRGDHGRSAYVIQPRGVWTGAQFTIRFPGPADGEIVEIYRRQ